MIAFFFLVSIQNVTSQKLDGSSAKHLQCLLSLDRSSDCPVNGEWSQWKAWGKCTGECGQTGRRNRQRLCNNPPPTHSGLKCQGSDIETESCVLPGCTEDQYWRMIQGDPLRVGQFDVLKEMHKKFTGISEMCLTNECDFNKLEKSIQDKAKAMQYWNALHCVKYAVGCPVAGGWSQWGSWSPCTAICGLGSKFRQRNCTNPPPSSEQFACKGDSYQNMTCSGISCAPRLDGVWSGWRSWSKCSVPCGFGFRTRARECLKKPEKRENYKLNIMEDEDSSMECRKIRDLDITNMCSGPNKEVEPCHNKDCAVDGQWSGWESWKPCSAECGIGSQSRSRSCSTPPPQGSGKMCPGLITEVRHCFERPCTVKRHHVAVLVGKGSILYSAVGLPSRLLHMYLRFKPQNAFGTLVYRYIDGCMSHSCDYISLSLEGGFLVLNALVSGCSVTTINNNKINNDEWHQVMFTVTGVVVTLRVDDAPERSTSDFKCQPVQPNLDHAMRIGERFRGEIERITVNYSPLHLKKLTAKGSKAHEAGTAPYGTSGVNYHVADNEEGYVRLVGKEMIKAPCPVNPNQWQVELAVKPEKLNAVLLYIQGDTADDHILVTLDSGRVKIRYKYGVNQSVAESPLEILQNKWLSLYVKKEAAQGDISMSVNGETHIVLPLTFVSNVSQIPMTCEGNIMIGDVTDEIEKLLKSQYSGIIVESLTGTLGFLAVDGIAEDIESLAMEQQRGLEFSSRSASISEKYEEVVMLIGQQLNLACLYDSENTKRKSKKAVWLRLDIPVKVEVEHNPEAASYSVKDNGHLTHITSSSYSTRKAIEGFYLCWVHQSSGGQGKVLLAYGVTVVDPAVEFVTISVEAMEAVAILSFILMAIFFVLMLLQVVTSLNEKFGVYQSILRRIKDEEITEEDKIKAMLDIIRSPKSLLILGSPEAVAESEEKLLQTMRLKGGEDISISESPIHPSDTDLPPIPRHKKRQVSSSDKQTKSLFRKFKKSKSILKVHDADKEELDSLEPLIKHKESSNPYKNSNELTKTVHMSKINVVKEFVKTPASKSTSGISKHKYDKLYDNDIPEKQNLELDHTKPTWNSGQLNLTIEPENSLKYPLEKYNDFKNTLTFERERIQEPLEYDLLTLLPELKMLPGEQRNSKVFIHNRVEIPRTDVKLSSTEQKENPTKKVEKLFNDTKKKSVSSKFTPEKEQRRKLVDNSMNEVSNLKSDYNCTPVKFKSPSFDAKHFERQRSDSVMMKPLIRKPLQKEGMKNVKRTDDLLRLHGVKISESLPDDKLRRKKVKTKIRTRKKEDKERPTIKTLSICKSFGESTESVRSVPTLAKMSEHHLILDESVNDIL